MGTQRIAAGIEINGFIERRLTALQPPHDRLEFLQCLFEAEASDA